MRQLSMLDRLEIAVGDREADRTLAAELRALVVPERAYVYHGTVWGRLESIAKLGLVPALKPVWTNRTHIQNHCREAVFFTTTWRSAVQWAQAAHSHTRGRRDSLVRRPVIVRIPTNELVIEPDRLAMAPRCLLVRGGVPTANAEAFIAPLAGFPTWQPLGSIVGAT
jgi:hypothetical protein